MSRLETDLCAAMWAPVWANVDLDRGLIRVVEQFNVKTRTFTPPKNGLSREAPLAEPAREAIVGLPVEGEFCFPPIRGKHWSASSRAYHWKAVRAVAGWQGSLYLATRHFARWYMVNVLELPRTWRSRSGTPTVASSSASSTGTATASARSTG